jgi:hypothetical protein
MAAALLAFSATLVVPAVAGAASGPTFRGPLLSVKETPSVSWARDGGVSLGLPNGKDLWIFGDTPRYQWSNGQWRLTAFIQGSTAAQRAYTPGKPLNGPLTEIRVGHPTQTANQPLQFLPSPKLYLPDGSGRACTKANGGPSVEAVRWVTGAALMPDRTNVLVPYVEVCVLDANTYRAEGFGFTLYNYKANKFSMKPYAVFQPTPDGAAMPTKQFFGSPVVKNGKVTFYSWECCSADSVFTTTVNATAAALKNPASYTPTATTGLPPTFNLSVTPPSKTHPKYTVYVLTGNGGEYEIYAGKTPTGPWKKAASGTLPRCKQAPAPCRSFALHPELSPAKRLIVSYYLANFGPGIATKHPSSKLPHTVMASIPCNC